MLVWSAKRIASSYQEDKVIEEIGCYSVAQMELNPPSRYSFANTLVLQRVGQQVSN